MKLLKEKLAEKIEIWRKEIKELSDNYGNQVVSEVTLNQLLGGMRGVKCLLTDTSEVPPEFGLIIRGRKISELIDQKPEEIFYLLLTGDLPQTKELEELSDELKRRKQLPDYVIETLKAMPEDSHPMTMFSVGILSMQRESIFYQKYSEGIKKTDYWLYMLEDALNIVAKAPSLAAAAYRIRYKNAEIIPSRFEDDFTEDFVDAVDLTNPNNEFYELMKLYFVLHCDHEGGNVSAMTTATVNSALSDLYYSLSAGLNGLSGPLHGLANQEVIKWIIETNEKFGGAPTKEQIEQYAWETLNAGKVIPGYGHAVLRVIDPRFTALIEFGKKYVKDDPVFNTVLNIFEVVPSILTSLKKIKDPWPNVDAASGALLYHYGLKEINFYTVPFGVSRILGLSAQSILSRALELPIIRPKSLTLESLKKLFNQ